MPSPWLGMVAVLAVFAGLTVGLAAYRLRCSPDAELVRKLLHAGMGLVTLTFPWLFSASWPVLLLAGVISASLMARKRSRILRRVFGNVIDGVRRDSLGEVYFALAVGLLFPLSSGDPLTFCVPMLILTLADPAAALIGGRYGVLRYSISGGEKSLEGSMAFLAVACVSSYLPLRLLGGTAGADAWLISLTLAVHVTLLEATAWRGLDNLFIPLGAYVSLRSSLDRDATMLATRLAVAGILLAAFGLVCRRRIMRKPTIPVSRDAVPAPPAASPWEVLPDGLG